MNDDYAFLCAENERLREQVAHLERALGLEYLPPVEWRLTPSEARLFGGLLARELLTTDAAMAVLYRDMSKDEADPKIIDVYICKIRKKLEPYGIEIATRWGAGYYLTSEGRALVNTMLEASHV